MAASVPVIVGCGGQEAIIVAFVIAVIVGAGRLPQIGDGLGRAVRNFRRALKGENEIDVTPKQLPKSDEDE